MSILLCSHTNARDTLTSINDCAKRRRKGQDKTSKSKRKIEQAIPQNAKIVTVNRAIETQQSLRTCAAPAPPQTPNKTALETLKEKTPEHSLKAPTQSDVTVKMISLQVTQPDTAKWKNKGEKLWINKTQSETDFEDISLVTSIMIDKTQASISQRVDDSADTGEYVDDLPEEHEQSSSE